MATSHLTSRSSGPPSAAAKLKRWAPTAQELEASIIDLEHNFSN